MLVADQVYRKLMKYGFLQICKIIKLKVLHLDLKVYYMNHNFQVPCCCGLVGMGLTQEPLLVLMV